MAGDQPMDQEPARELQTSFSGRTVSPGDRVRGTIVKITGAVAFVDFGYTSQGYIQLAELRDAEGNLDVGEGSEVEAEVVSTRSGVELSARKAQEGAVLEGLHAAWKSQTPVDGRIVATNKGGFEIRVSGVRAFCPASQLAERFIREPAREVGKTYSFLITEYGEGKSLVVSRRALLEESRQQINDRVKVGEHLQGRVTQLQDFGAFIDIGGGVEGLVHVSEISHGRVAHPREKLTVGDAVEVKVIKVDADKGRVGLSIKALEGSPFADFVATVEVGQVIEGTVDRVQPFGAFVRIAPGVDGLLHVSAIKADERIEEATGHVKEGEVMQLVVQRIEKDRERVALCTPEVWEARKPAEIPFKVGDTLKGTVTKHERFGVFVQLAPKIIGLCPNPEMATERGANHGQMFPVGSEFDVKVLEIDAQRGRIRVSRKALIHTDEDDYREWRKSQKTEEKTQSLGTFGDLLKDFLKS